MESEAGTWKCGSGTTCRRVRGTAGTSTFFHCIRWHQSLVSPGSMLDDIAEVPVTTLADASREITAMKQDIGKFCQDTNNALANLTTLVQQLQIEVRAGRFA
ncbi:hypothetical protein ACLB2K_074122 [Fragaria x ananassa]